MSLNIVLVLTVVNLVASGVLCNGSGNNGGKAIVDNSVITKIMDKIDMLEQEVARLKQNSEDSSRERRLLLQQASTVTPVTQPVAFSVYLDHPIKGLGPGQTIVYNKIIFNSTTAYSPYTGIFSVPKSGIYLFSWTGTARKISGEHSYDIWNSLKVNGRKIASSVSESDIVSEDQQGSATVVYHCNQGDAVWTSSCCHGHDIWGDSVRTTLFSSVLLYAD